MSVKSVSGGVRGWSDGGVLVREPEAWDSDAADGLSLRLMLCAKDPGQMFSKLVLSMSADVKFGSRWYGEALMVCCMESSVRCLFFGRPICF